MAFIPVPNTATFALRGTLHGQQVVNTLSFTRLEGWSLPVLGGFCETLQGWWSSELQPYVSTALQMVDVYGLSLDSTTAPSVTANWVTTPSAGDDASAALPGNVAFCVSFRTGARGRSGRGRNYVPGMTEFNVTGNQLSQARADAIRGAYDALLGLGDPIGATWVVIQKYSNGNALPAGIPRPVVFVTYADLTVDTMSGRLG